MVLPGMVMFAFIALPGSCLCHCVGATFPTLLPTPCSCQWLAEFACSRPYTPYTCLPCLPRTGCRLRCRIQHLPRVLHWLKTPVAVGRALPHLFRRRRTRERPSLRTGQLPLFLFCVTTTTRRATTPYRTRAHTTHGAYHRAGSPPLHKLCTL